LIFNVNGRSDEQLLATLKLAFLNEYGNTQKARAWKVDINKGLILFWHYDSSAGSFPFPTSLNAEEVFPLVKQYLADKETWENTVFGEWEDNLQGFDGIIDKGWRVYTERWGKIEKAEYQGYDYSFLAIKPCYCWYGK
jgi:hypothetical protein